MRNARVKPRFLIRGDGVRLGNVGRGRTCLKRVGSSIVNAGFLTECVVCPSDRVGDTRCALPALLPTPVFVSAVAVPEGPGLV